MKPAVTFTTIMILGFAATLLAQPSQSTDPNANPPSKVAEAPFSPEGKQLMATSPDNTVRIWDVATGKPLSGPLTQVVQAQFSPDGRRVVTTSKDGTSKVWDVETRKLLSGLTNHLGTWQLVSLKYGDESKWSDAPSDQRRIKLITETHFTWVAYAVASGKARDITTLGGWRAFLKTLAEK